MVIERDKNCLLKMGGYKFTTLCKSSVNLVPRPAMIKIHTDILSHTVSQGCLTVPLGLDSGITVVVKTAIEPG